MRPLLPRSAPTASGMSSRAIAKLLDRLEEQSVECHSLMVVRRGHVVAEGWWAPYSAERPHLLYSLTKSFTSVAVGLTIADGLLSLDDRVVDVLPDHVPAGLSEQGRRVTVHHLLSMTAGHGTDSLTEAWQLEPDDLVKGFLRVPFTEPEGTRHTYDNATTFILARMVERVTGRSLPELLDERLFTPMGIDHAEWDRVASGAAFGFHGLHLTTEAVAAFGEPLLRGGVWGDRQLIPRDWVELATRRHIATLQLEDDSANPDFLYGYGYQFWMSRNGYFGNGAFGQQCLVVPSHDLVVVVTAAVNEEHALPSVFWDCLLPGLDDAGSAQDDEILAERLRRLSLAPVPGSAAPQRSVKARLEASAEDSPLPDGTTVIVDPVDGGWLLRFGSSLDIEAGHGEWRESSPLGRPVVATGAWQGNSFVADLYVITTPHRVRLVVDADAGTAVATWNIVPLTGPSLTLHVRSPLMTRPDVA
ncbi:CubicO group peptidase (beta-lactamase class C family) [Kribbella antiqua]|uniref:CubicO group peptidase (Beta-lactamase class C family) n=1 Tax=Kribbella antiqua TaxID=2512217 RepID=A0A4R2IXS8_9ACTN|nr:serine hydrolase domain-containing protein [Kribbella antiqua]TCO49296.1 CubicO group peptidase (beta-lactamase class C family) [Kribbella antiqua]